MILLTLLAAILIAALMFAAVYAFSYGIAKVALKVLPESDPNEGLPMCARKQQEVQDSWLAIAENGHNLRGEYAFQVQQERHCSWSEAIYIMICHDCEDMGIQVMNTLPMFPVIPSNSSIAVLLISTASPVPGNLNLSPATKAKPLLTLRLRKP